MACQTFIGWHQSEYGETLIARESAALGCGASLSSTELSCLAISKCRPSPSPVSRLRGKARTGPPALDLLLSRFVHLISCSAEFISPLLSGCSAKYGRRLHYGSAAGLYLLSTQTIQGDVCPLTALWITLLKTSLNIDHLCSRICRLVLLEKMSFLWPSLKEF